MADSQATGSKISASIIKTNPFDNDIQNPMIIYGSTLGGCDPLHAQVINAGREPQFWKQMREYNEAKSKKREISGGASDDDSQQNWLDPKTYDVLPYSTAHTPTSGMDLYAKPEASADEFWGKVMWALHRKSMR